MATIMRRSYIPDIGDLKDRFERMGLVMISEGMLGEEVYTRTYSITANTTFSIGGTTLEKREINVEGEKCTPHCLQMNPGPNPDDCATLYSELNGQATQISVKPRMSRFSSWFIRRVMAPD